MTLSLQGPHPHAPASPDDRLCMHRSRPTNRSHQHSNPAPKLTIRPTACVDSISFKMEFLESEVRILLQEKIHLGRYCFTRPQATRVQASLANATLPQKRKTTDRDAICGYGLRIVRAWQSIRSETRRHGGHGACRCKLWFSIGGTRWHLEGNNQTRMA